MGFLEDLGKLVNIVRKELDKSESKIKKPSLRAGQKVISKGIESAKAELKTLVKESQIEISRDDPRFREPTREFVAGMSTIAGEEIGIEKVIAQSGRQIGTVETVTTRERIGEQKIIITPTEIQYYENGKLSNVDFVPEGKEFVIPSKVAGFKTEGRVGLTGTFTAPLGTKFTTKEIFKRTKEQISRELRQPLQSLIPTEPTPFTIRGIDDGTLSIISPLTRTEQQLKLGALRSDERFAYRKEPTREEAFKLVKTDRGEVLQRRTFEERTQRAYELGGTVGVGSLLARQVALGVSDIPETAISTLTLPVVVFTDPIGTGKGIAKGFIEGMLFEPIRTTTTFVGTGKLFGGISKATKISVIKPTFKVKFAKGFKEVRIRGTTDPMIHGKVFRQAIDVTEKILKKPPKTPGVVNILYGEAGISLSEHTAKLLTGRGFGAVSKKLIKNLGKKQLPAFVSKEVKFIQKLSKERFTFQREKLIRRIYGEGVKKPYLDIKFGKELKDIVAGKRGIGGKIRTPASISLKADIPLGAKVSVRTRVAKFIKFPTEEKGFRSYKPAKIKKTPYKPYTPKPYTTTPTYKPAPYSSPTTPQTGVFARPQQPQLNLEFIEVPVGITKIPPSVSSSFIPSIPVIRYKTPKTTFRPDTRVKADVSSIIKSATRSITASTRIIKQDVSIAQINKIAQKSISLQKSVLASKQIVNTQSIQKQVQKQVQIQKQVIGQDLKISQALVSIPIKPPVFAKPPVVRIKKASDPFKRLFKGTQTIKRTRSKIYTPSLGGLFTGKTIAKIPKPKFAGLGLRPIVKRKRKVKRKPKRKKKRKKKKR